MKLVRILALALLCATFAACAESPTAPSTPPQRQDVNGPSYDGGYAGSGTFVSVQMTWP